MSPVKGQIIAVMVMFQETSIRNLANDGSSTQSPSWPVPGRAYWMDVTRLSLKYPHDMFGYQDGAHDTDSVGLYQQRPAYGWGNYGASTGTTDPEGVIQRLLDPRWEAMAFFGGDTSAAPTRRVLDVAGWQSMSLTYAANAVQGSNYPTLYAQWEAPATKYVTDNQDTPSITLPWYPAAAAERWPARASRPTRRWARPAAIPWVISTRWRSTAPGSGSRVGRSNPTPSTG